MKTLNQLQELLVNLQAIHNLTLKVNKEHPSYKLPVRQVKDNVSIVIKRISKYHDTNKRTINNCV